MFLPVPTIFSNYHRAEMFKTLQNQIFSTVSGLTATKVTAAESGKTKRVAALNVSYHGFVLVHCTRIYFGPPCTFSQPILPVSVNKVTVFTGFVRLRAPVEPRQAVTIARSLLEKRAKYAEKTITLVSDQVRNRSRMGQNGEQGTSGPVAIASRYNSLQKLMFQQQAEDLVMSFYMQIRLVWSEFRDVFYLAWKQRKNVLCPLNKNATSEILSN